MKSPRNIPDCLPEWLYKCLLEHVDKHVRWDFGAKSNGETDPYGHLSYKPFHDKQENLADIESDLSLDSTLRNAWNHLRMQPWLHEFLGGRPVLIRYYLNSYTYGMDGYFHTDSSREGEATIILFLCNDWDRDWAGEFTCRGDNGEGWYVPPQRNHAVLIPSDMWHCGRSVSRKCTKQRTVLVLKMRKEQSVPYEMLSRFLVERGALRLEHAKGTLHDHLVRVYARLELRNLPLPVCLGGGLHSVYGTNVFKSRLLAPDDAGRRQVRDRFGEEAEKLARAFGALNNRPKSLSDATVAAHPDVVRSLCLIEAANLADQGQLHNWPKLKKLWESI